MNLQPNRTLWALTAGQRARYGAAIAALALGNLVLFGVPKIAQVTIDALRIDDPRGVADRGEPGDVVRLLLGAAVGVVGLTALAGLLQYLRGRWAAQASEGIVRALRERLFGHLQRIPCAHHDGADTGDLVQRCTSDVETLRVFLAQQVVEIGRAVLLLVTALPWMWSLDGRMTLVSVALYPLIVAFAILFFRRIQVVFRTMDEAEGRMTATLQENLTGIRVVRAFARQDHERARFGERNGAFRDGHLKLLRLLGTYWAVSDFLCIGQIVLVLFAGAHWAAAGELTVGTLFAFLAAESIVIWPVRHMGRVLADAGKATVAVERLGEILEVAEESGAGTRPDAPLQGELVVEGLSFAYGDGPDVLRDVSFRVRAGETLALLGPPGSGKTTIVSLLLRLYDYERGSIRLDGHELSDLDRRWVRSQVASVLQEPFLYSKTLDANVRLGHPDAPEDEVVSAARAADVHDTFEGFEQGYATEVGERGVTLSGGQRQRTAIARALLVQAPILVLDDALSAVDTRTEARILDALRERTGDRTTLVVSHRLSSVAHADRILVLEEGSIAQQGTHDELVRAEGPYRRLWRIQGQMEDELARELDDLGGLDADVDADVDSPGEFGRERDPAPHRDTLRRTGTTGSTP